MLDELLFNAIPDDDTALPDVENGLVLLSHIRQHLENGLGLRQIIDWFMFVNAFLGDQLWYSSFQKKAQDTGLESLAIVTTKMCQKYLGLTQNSITWCKEADDDLCDSLMNYVLECGDFGRSLAVQQSPIITEFPSLSQPLQLFKYIQLHGEQNWKLLIKYPWLKSVAWIYQSCRYIAVAVKNKVGAKEYKKIYEEGQQRSEMFEALGLR